MKVYCVTQDNPEGIDRFQLFTTKELADKAASLWVDEDNEQRQEMLERDPEFMENYRWRWDKELEQWGYGFPDDEGNFCALYCIFVEELEVHDSIPKK